MTKIKMVMTQATTAVIYNDNSNAFLTLETVGKLNLNKAKKHFKENANIANAKMIEVVAVEYSNVTYSIEDEKLLEFLKQNGTLVIDTENETKVDTENEPNIEPNDEPKVDTENEPKVDTKKGKK